MANDKTRTNLSLDGPDLEKKLHALGGSSKKYDEVLRQNNQRSEIRDALPTKVVEYGFVDMEDSQPQEVQVDISNKIVPFDEAHLDEAHQCSRQCYSYEAEENDKKKYWLDVYQDKVILITTQMPYGELADPSKKHNTYLPYFKADEIAAIIEHVKKQNPGLDLHVIIPRVEKGVIDDHIVIEYRTPKGATLVIDSKPFPSGTTYEGERINTGRQDYTNAEDCGFHVVQTIPILKGFIRHNIEISKDDLNSVIEQAGHKSFFLHKFEKLQGLYNHRRYKEGNQKYQPHSLLCCFSFIFSYFGYEPSVKEEAVKQIIENIKQGFSVFHSLKGDLDGAAKQGVLGETVRAFLEAEEASLSAEASLPEESDSSEEYLF